MTKVMIAEITTENKDDLLKVALGMYLGEKCQGCGKAFETLGDLENAVWWPWDGGRVGHKSCFDKDQEKKSQ